MSRIRITFEELQGRHEKALIPFMTAGDPTQRKSIDYFRALEAGGADIIELGMPFSDPMADGPVIQAADERALAGGMGVVGLLEMVATLRRSSQIPIVLMGYYNPIHHYGVNSFAKDASQAGVDACLIVDLPPEEAGEVQPQLTRRGIDFVYLLAPTSHADRLKLVARRAQGYLYYVSMTGITGARLSGLGPVKTHVREIRRYTDLPIAVGFGIATAKQARAVASFADAVVIGSAFVKEVARGVAPRHLERMARRFKKGIS